MVTWEMVHINDLMRGKRGVLRGGEDNRVQVKTPDLVFLIGWRDGVLHVTSKGGEKISVDPTGDCSIGIRARRT